MMAPFTIFPYSLGSPCPTQPTYQTKRQSQTPSYHIRPSVSDRTICPVGIRRKIGITCYLINLFFHNSQPVWIKRETEKTRSGKCVRLENPKSKKGGKYRQNPSTDNYLKS